MSGFLNSLRSAFGGDRPYAEIDSSALKTALATGDKPFLLDVRTPAEFAEGHIPGTVNVPLDQLPARLGELNAHKVEDIVVVCRSGVRSARAAELMATAGFSKLTNLAGGTMGWASSGYPIER